MEDRQSEAEGLASACFRGYYEIAPGREMLERGRLDLGRRGKIELGEAGEQARLEREVGPAAAVALALAAFHLFNKSILILIHVTPVPPLSAGRTHRRHA